MAKQTWKPGNMVYPIPAVLVTVSDKEGNDNVLTVAWTGTVCSDPVMAYVSIRPSRHSYHMIKETGEFVINLTTEALAYATDFCGVKSGKDMDKFKECRLTKEKATYVAPPLIKESPVNIECKVVEVRPCGSHDMFIGEVVAVHADEQYMDEKGSFDLSKAKPLVYSHGQYYGLGKKIGRFGYSVTKNSNKKRGSKNNRKTKR
ncbi:MAG: flavin reductase family protein [Lachnospiraceae bacterium]|nr:flavin reductase family protein [Lachnospiraceae bacterium]